MAGAKLDHVGVAVESISAARKLYEAGLGLPLGGEEVLEDKGLSLAFFEAGGGVKIELLEGRGDDPISKFIAGKGPGIHHICFRVDDIDEAVATLRRDGYEFLTQEPYAGAEGSRVIFMKPASGLGVLIELIQEA
ncbi:MAG: methylmalonyl-CoA epimerase [Candidatus Zixiibacteriota bacterium]|jgi:methylmalonyl-CoA/ethylmalonyl-CoA epimerase